MWQHEYLCRIHTHTQSLSLWLWLLSHTHSLTHMKTKHLELCSCYSASPVPFSRVDVDGDVYIYLYLYLYAVYSITYQHFDRVNRSLGLRPASLCALQHRLSWGRLLTHFREMCGHLLAYKDTQLCIQFSALPFSSVSPRPAH